MEDEWIEIKVNKEVKEMLDLLKNIYGVKDYDTLIEILVKMYKNGGQNESI
jgi:hypothetical protein